MDMKATTVTTKTSKRQVPTLSLRNYTDGTEKEQLQFIDNLYTGIKDYGFIVLKDHDIPQELFDRAYALLEKFYSLPTETKMKYAKVHGGQRGYTPFGKEHAKDSPVMDLKEFWHVGHEVPDAHKFSKYYPKNVWPEEIPEFKNVFSTLYQSLNGAGKAMLQAGGGRKLHSAFVALSADSNWNGPTLFAGGSA